LNTCDSEEATNTMEQIRK